MRDIILKKARNVGLAVLLASVQIYTAGAVFAQTPTPTPAVNSVTSTQTSPQPEFNKTVYTQTERTNPALYVTAENKACKIYNPFPRAGEVARFEGECQNGLAEGKGVVYWFTASTLKEVNEGTYKEGKLTGLCDLRLVDSLLNYRGECQDGQPHGQGTMRYLDGNIFTGSFEKGRAMVKGK